MSLREQDGRRSGRRSRDPSPAYYDDRRSSRYQDDRYERDDEPRYARAEKTSEVPYAGKKTASFAMPGEIDDDERYEKKEVRYEVKKREEDPTANGDKNEKGGGKYDDHKFKEPTSKYYDDEPPTRESKRYYEEPMPERERSRERSSKQYYEDGRRYEQAPKRESQYYEREETETRYAISKPSKYESSPKPKYATPVHAPSVAAATRGSVISGANPNYYGDESSDSDSGRSDGKTGDRKLEVEIDFKHDHEDVSVRRRPSRKKHYHLDESSSALVTTTTTTSGARLDSRYDEQGRYGYAAPANSYDRPPGRPVSMDYDGVKYDSHRPGYGSARTSETRVTTINGKKSELDVVTAEPGHRKRVSMSGGLGANLAVAGGAAAGLSLSQAPGSPMLEAYRGTYQSMGSMPSPLMMPSSGFSLSQDVAILDLNRASSPSGRERRARFRDMVKDASDLKDALRDNGKGRPPPAEPFIRILPSLSHEEVLELRKKYKEQVKTPDHRGVNIAKHIKMRLKEDKLFLKCCYTTALGKWESEGYWANSYYNSSRTSRDLLIESLMGRSNQEIREIKAGFKDKKYSDDLVKCMKTELKEDKFKKAIMLVLKEQKMEESRRIDPRQVEDDVRDLYRAIRSERGGETAMMEIVVLGSEKHMREVLSLYERRYGANLAKDIISKSGNLVGEMLVHILNGIINRASRDAMLLKHALSLPVSSSSTHRPDLLISRLVRLHWNRNHLEATKREFRRSYGMELQEAVRRGTRGVWGEFCTELCVRRQGAEVREYERGERIVMDR